MLSELITWWIQQMADLTAPLLSRITTAIPDALLLTPVPAGIRIDRRRKGKIEPIAILNPDAPPVSLNGLLGRRRREPVVLVLPSPLLICETTLPAAAQNGLERVLRYEMDRLTPFAADDVFFTYELLESHRARATLRVRLAFVPRIQVQPLLDRLVASGAVPETLEAAGPNGVIHRVPIGRFDPASQARGRLLSRLTLTACAALAVAIFALPLVRQSLALADVEDRIAELHPGVAQVEALRKQIAAGTAGAGRIEAAREQAGLILRMLSVLTDTLPDDTWLTSLTLRQHTLVMEGHSTASTKLIAGMAAEPRLHDPAFAAPVLRDENGGEVFTIRAGYGP